MFIVAEVVIAGKYRILQEIGWHKFYTVFIHNFLVLSI